MKGLAALIAVFLLADAAQAQTANHGYAVAGVSDSQGTTTGGATALIGGGFAYPLRKGRFWIAGDVTSHVVEGYFDATGGPAAVVGLGSFKGHRFEPFAQGGPRWGDAAQLWGNVGSGAHVWMTARVGLRVEYQYQWHRATVDLLELGPSGVVRRTIPNVRFDEHMMRVGMVFR